MHDLDHTLLESGWDEGHNHEHTDRLDYDPTELHEAPPHWTGGDIFDGDEEDELATDLLNATTDEELDQFLGKLARKVGRKIKRAVPGAVGKVLRGGLKRVAKSALPAVAGLIPGGGTVVAAGRMLGLELDGMSPEDQEFATARQLVRLAADANADVAENSESGQQPQDAAKAALSRSAQRHAPGILAGRDTTPRPSRRTPRPGRPGGQSGSWVRRGDTIVLRGV